MDIKIKKNSTGKYSLSMNRAFFTLSLKDLIDMQEEINKVLDDAAREMTFDEFMKAYNPESF